MHPICLIYFPVFYCKSKLGFHHCACACAAHVQVTRVYYVFRFLRGYAVSCWLMFYFRPLLCSLVQWLKHSRKEYCELCKHRFAFTPSKYSGRCGIIRFNTTNAVKFPQQLIEMNTHGFPVGHRPQNIWRRFCSRMHAFVN